MTRDTLFSYWKNHDDQICLSLTTLNLLHQLFIYNNCLIYVCKDFVLVINKDFFMEMYTNIFKTIGFI